MDAKYPAYVNKTSPKSYLNELTKCCKACHTESETFPTTIRQRIRRHPQTAVNDRVGIYTNNCTNRGIRSTAMKEIFYIPHLPTCSYTRKSSSRETSAIKRYCWGSAKPDGSPYYDGAGKELKEILQARRRKSESVISAVGHHDNLPRPK